MSEDDALTESVEVWFKLIKSKDGYPNSQDWEELWARREKEAFRVDSIPFFENRVSKGDLISTSRHPKGFLQFDCVLQRGAHSTFRIWVDTNRVSVKEAIEELERLGAACEVTLERLVAIDVGPVAMRVVENVLIKGRDSGKWQLQDGFIFEQATDTPTL